MFTTLISAVNLALHARQADWVIFDCRHDLQQPAAGREAYQAGHIPGAFFADVETDLAGPKTGSNGRHPLPDPKHFQTFVQQCGVNDSTQVIAYDASAGMFAARLWWMLRWIGHESVAVLDGGLPAWLREGYALSQAQASASEGGLSVRTTRVRSVGAPEILCHLGDGKNLLIDARAPERYRGDSEPLDKLAGHIPGALNRFYPTNLQADLRFKPAAELRAEFEALLGTRPPEEVVHQCGSGVSACHNLLAMEVAGLHGSALYPGSWSEWSALANHPVATGDAPLLGREPLV